MMISEYSLQDETQMKQWDEFVTNHPEGTAFHLSGWIRSIREAYGVKPLLYCLQKGDGQLCGLVPFIMIKSPIIGKRIVSLPFSDHSGPICNDLNQEKELLKGVIDRHKDSVRYIEVRSSLHDTCGLNCRDYYKRHILALNQDPHVVMKKLEKRTIQYGIRKAARTDLEIREDNTVHGINEFYRLNRLTRKKHGVPSQPRIFFDKLYEHMVTKGFSFILLVYDGDDAIAAGFFSKLKETIYYKYNASDPHYLDRTKRTPNHLLTWFAIQQACKAGYKYFDFGRTSPDNTGLMRYKEMWGAQPHELPYYYYPKAMGASSQEGSGFFYKMLTNVWRTLPDSVVDFIEPKIYKHMA
jgi:serine/alanine adding enzyme